MSAEILLHIVTDNPQEACKAVLGCALEELPPFVGIVTKAGEIRRIPDGARCYGYWTAWSDRRPTEAMLAWRDRRDDASVNGTSGRFLDRVQAWLRDRDAQFVEQARAEALAERATPSDTAPATDTLPPPDAPVKMRLY